MNRRLILTFIFTFIFSITPSIWADSSPVEIYINAPDDSSFELDFRSNEKVTHFEFYFTPPKGSRVLEILNTPGEVTFTEVWEKENDRYSLKYKIDIFNYYGISSEDYRTLAKIVYDRYKLKGNQEFSFDNFKTRNNDKTFQIDEVVFHNSPYSMNFGQGLPMEKIEYSLEVDTTSLRLIENSDSCFVLMDCYIKMYNTKEMISNLTFDFIVPNGSELVRVEPLRRKGLLDPYKVTDFNKTAQNGYSVSLKPSQSEWPIEPYSGEQNGSELLKLSVHIYDFCHDITNDIELANIVSINEESEQNNETTSAQNELLLEDFYYSNFLKGDVNGYCFGNNAINSNDINDLAKYLDEIIAFNCYQKWAADMDDNGIIDQNDLGELKGFSSIEESESNFSIYPNPASEIILIQTEKQIDSIELFDIQGRLINTYQTKEINISDLISGTYIIKINFGSSSETQKIIIQ